MMQFVKTRGILALEQQCGSPFDWQLIISIITRLNQDNEHFLSFDPKLGKTIITDGNENHLCTVEKQLFPSSVKVWAIYGNDGSTEYFTVLLPEEY
jgi:hypothetical protein